MRDQTQSAERAAPCKELAALIKAGLAQLPEAERTTLVLADMHGLTYEEIASRTRVPVGTVGARLSGARLSLRAFILKHQELLSAQYRYTPGATGEFGQAVAAPVSTR